MNDGSRFWTIVGGIAGLISAIVAVWQFLKEPAATPSAEKPKREISAAVPVSQNILVDQKTTTTVAGNSNVEVDTSSNQQVRIVSTTSLEDIENRLEITKRLFSTTAKDQALEELANIAVDNNYHELALRISSQMFSTTNKDRTLEKISNNCSRNKNFKCSAEANSSMFSTTTADRAWSELAVSCHFDKQVDCMNAALSKIFSTTTKDQTIRRIVIGK